MDGEDRVLGMVSLWQQNSQQSQAWAELLTLYIPLTYKVCLTPSSAECRRLLRSYSASRLNQPWLFLWEPRSARLSQKQPGF